jgi:hypothetical protein
MCGKGIGCDVDAVATDEDGVSSSRMLLRVAVILCFSMVELACVFLRVDASSLSLLLRYVLAASTAAVDSTQRWSSFSPCNTHRARATNAFSPCPHSTAQATFEAMTLWTLFT